MNDHKTDPKTPTTGGLAQAAEPETFIAWLLQSPWEEAGISELVAFVRAAEGAPRNGSPADLANWLGNHRGPVRPDQVEHAADIWRIRKRIES